MGHDAGAALLLLYWTVPSIAGFLDARILPPPWTAVTTAISMIDDGRLQQHVAVSAGRALGGLACGTIVGVALALLSGLTLLSGYVIDGLVQLKRGIPILALIPFMILWFGIGETMKVAVIAIAVFVPIYVQTHTALRAIDIRYVELAETLRLSRWQFLRHIVLPGALPGFLTGMRFGVTNAWLALVVVEQLNATSGMTRTRMHALLRRLSDVYDPAILFVTYDIDEAILLADRIVMLDDGKLSFDMPIALSSSSRAAQSPHIKAELLNKWAFRRRNERSAACRMAGRLWLDRLSITMSPGESVGTRSRPT